MDKSLFAILILFLSLPVLATCPNKVDPSKVMLFVDANFGDPEIAAAEKSACKRGERLEVVPKNWKEYSVFQKKIEAANNAFRACSSKNPANAVMMFAPAQPNSDCDKQFESLRNANLEFQDFTKKQKPIQNQVRARVEELSKEKVRLTNLTLSGHNGGGHFGGSKGSIGREEIAEFMKEFPEMNGVESLLLLGCYTGVQREVAAWKSIFPNVKLIGGYDGSAPNSFRLEGHNYITNILNKEKTLLSLKNKSSVDADVKRLIGNLGGLNSAMYIDLACKEEDDEFYYASKLDRTFTKLNLNDCQKSLAELDKVSPYYRQLYSGEIEPPTETSSGPSRNLYDKIRTHDHCFESGMMNLTDMSSNGAFNLLFWHGVKQNFANYYQQDMKEAEEILKSLTMEDLAEEILAKIKEFERDKKIALAKIEEYKKDPKALLAKTEAEVSDLTKKMDEYRRETSYLELMSRVRSAAYIPNAEDVEKFKPLREMEDQYYIKSEEVTQMKSTPPKLIENKNNDIEMFDFALTGKNGELSQAKDSFEKIKKVWIPTKENMSVKTRKEVLENIHNINGFLTNNNLPKKLTSALRFVNTTSTQHLQYFQNPFSWHEYTGETEQPQRSQKLANYLNGNTMMSEVVSGLGVGYASGTLTGGGIVGGGMGGAGGGTTDEQPEH